jgi:hypothetical protein
LQQVTTLIYCLKIGVHYTAGFCALSERLKKSGFRLGARRQKTGRPSFEAAGVDPEKRADGDCLIAVCPLVWITMPRQFFEGDKHD